MGSDENRFNVSFISRVKVRRQCPLTTTFEEKGELKRRIEPTLFACQPDAFPLGQTGPQSIVRAVPSAHFY